MLEIPSIGGSRMRVRVRSSKRDMKLERRRVVVAMVNPLWLRSGLDGLIDVVGNVGRVVAFAPVAATPAEATFARAFRHETPGFGGHGDCLIVVLLKELKSRGC